MAPPTSSALARPIPLARDWFAGLIFVLTLVRWLVPAEATAEGETLWIALGWFIAGALMFLLPRRGAGGRRPDEGVARGRVFDRESTSVQRSPTLPNPLPRDGGEGTKLTWADLAVGLLVTGHVLSGLFVVISGGDRRAAINLSWEWLSLGVCWWIWRMLLSRTDIRRQLVPFLMTTALTLSVWGLWQYFIWYPQMAAKFGPLVEQINAGHETPEIRRQLIDAGIPLENPARDLFIGRLLRSREPFGPFALANTYGGLLAAWLVLGLLITLSDAPQKRSAATRVGSWIATIPIALALYLTNSRTAWVGALTALAARGVIQIAHNSTSPRIKRWLLPALTFAGCVVGLSILAVILRGEHAVPGPLKSLAYRGEYWIGTMRMLIASPWIGNGLGQFRDRYPAYKVPESSEEITDPHNLFLDVWANGGLIALAGLVVLLMLLLGRLRALQSPPSATAGPISAPPPTWRFAGAAGFLLAIIVPVLNTGLWDDPEDRLAIFGTIWFALSWLTPRWFAESGNSRIIALLAALALAVHLLGAGGIGMPAVTQLLLLLVAWGITDEAGCDANPKASSFSFWLPPAICAVLAAGCYFTAWQPVHVVQSELQQGDVAWLRNNSEPALRHFRAATLADPYTAETWVRLAEAEYAQHRNSPEAALNDLEEALRRTPDRAMVWQRKGQMLAEAAQRTQRPEDWQAARDAFENAAQRHPTDAALLADLAEALSHGDGSEATAAAARRAIEQDDLNHRRGHTDQYLPQLRRQKLERLAGK